MNRPQGDYDYILKETDAFSSEGLDFYRALQDLSDQFRYKLVEQLSGGGNESYPEQMVRILDALREGDELVRLGLSEKTNFEVTLFRAVESGKARSIDQVIRKISKVLPQEDIKKKTELNVSGDEQSNSSLSEPTDKSSNIESDVHAGISTSKRQSGAKPPVIDESSENDNGTISSHHGALDHEKPHLQVDIRQIQDENEIRKRVDELPEELRKSLVDEFKVNFVSIEQIDPKQLI